MSAGLVSPEASLLGVIVDGHLFPCVSTWSFLCARPGVSLLGGPQSCWIDDLV